MPWNEADPPEGGAQLGFRREAWVWTESCRQEPAAPAPRRDNNSKGDDPLEPPSSTAREARRVPEPPGALIKELS